MARTPLSGIQHSLRSGDYEAIISSVGATLRSLTLAGWNTPPPAPHTASASAPCAISVEPDR